MKQNAFGSMEQKASHGDYLAESKWKPIVEGLEGTDRAFTSLCLENTQVWLSSLSESVRTTNVGNFDRFAFPLVRTVFPNLVAHDLVSVQPMDGPTGLIFYFDLIYGSNKGSITAGTSAFSSLTGHPGDSFYSSDEILTESVGTGTGSVDNFTVTLAYAPIIPGTLEVTDGTQTVTDDSAGNIIGDISSGTNTINYTTGALNFDFLVNVTSGATVTADYRYDNEANDQVPEIDFQLTSAPVIARINKLRTRYSLEAAQNLRALHGLSAENELLVALAQELRFEIDRSIIKDVNSSAEATAVTWPLGAPSGISYTEHKLSLVDRFIASSNNIFTLTRRGQPNWIIMGMEVANVIESLPGFQPSDQSTTPTGVVYAGTLNGRWKIYKDPYNIDGTDSQKNFLVGYKGSSFLDAGYVYAPYIPFYTTPTVILDDFIARKGMATQWGKRKVNGRFYGKGTVTGNFSP